MDYKQALAKLTSINQQHLLAHWKQLPPLRQDKLLDQIQKLDISQFEKNKTLLGKKASLPFEEFEPFHAISYSGNTVDFKNGKKIIAQGQLGTIVMAGGQGTRLGFNGPKGLFPVSLIKHKSLFQLFAEKTLAASKQAGRPLTIAFMTSPLNHQATVEFFESHAFFGLDPSQISFFSQEMLPFFNEKGDLFLDEANQIAEGPDGNGSALYHFVHSGVWENWSNKGIRYLNFVLIDNPLADPYDAELVGFHIGNKCQITVKCCTREDAQEKVGLLVQKNNHAHVVEYTEIPEEERIARTQDGSLKYRCANLSLFCFGMNHVYDLVKKSGEMPLHLAHKNNVWKFEKFIFDVLPMSQNVKALIYPREECFAPLKNKTGPDSIATVQKALQRQDRKTIERITGIHPPDRPFELAQEFYYPTPELLKNWKGRPLPPVPYIQS